MHHNLDPSAAVDKPSSVLVYLQMTSANQTLLEYRSKSQWKLPLNPFLGALGTLRLSRRDFEKSSGLMGDY